MDATTPIRLRTPDKGWQELKDFPAGGGWPAEVHYFVNALLAGEEITPNGYDGLISVRAALAAYDSHRLGVRVSLA